MRVDRPVHPQHQADHHIAAWDCLWASVTPPARRLASAERLGYQAPEGMLAGRIRNPSPDQIARCRYWHTVSRGPGGFAASRPWEHWLSREIPPGAVVPEPRPLSAPAPPEPAYAQCAQAPETIGKVLLFLIWKQHRRRAGGKGDQRRRIR
jgi:hypothetical protein